jgi:hypothetical protein
VLSRLFYGIHDPKSGTVIASIKCGQLTTKNSRRLIELCQEETRAAVIETETARVNLPAEATLDRGAQAAAAAIAEA